MGYLSFISLSLVIAMATVQGSDGQQSKALSYTLLKLHTFKTETELCKKKFKDAGRYPQRQNASLSFGLVPNCSNCEKLTVQQHLIRIHKVAKRFAKPLGFIYAFEIKRQETEITNCVESVQLELLTLIGVTEMQIPRDSISQHSSASMEALKVKARKYLEKLAGNSGTQVLEEDVMKTVGATLMKEMFLAAVVMQKSRLEIQNMVTSNNVF
ncbi:uncharacterized protein LOC135692953 [Rhopilema esculentum]|uniref:uncharacterized protein LOC135692953 n=1 Tax=Rhopilema esculentum TaxID=499914 RepID=UPI0031E4770E|eukprot:gene2423-18074_t